MFIATAPKYETPTAAHAIAVEFEQAHGKLLSNPNYKLEYLAQPLQPNLPYIPDEHMELLTNLANDKVERLVIIGRPANLKMLKSLGPTEKLVLLCTPMVDAALDDYEGLDTLGANKGIAYAFDKRTAEWLSYHLDQPVEQIKLELPYYAPPTTPEKQDTVHVLVPNSAAATRLASMGLKGITLVVTPDIMEQLTQTTTAVQRPPITPLDPERGLTAAVTECKNPTCFVIDKTMTIPTLLDYFSRGMYPVLGAQYDEVVFEELAILLDIPQGNIVRVLEVAETIPPEAARDLTTLAEAITAYRASDKLAFKDVITQLGVA